ncbi:MAG: hypothetical protein KGY65_03385 [Candidatus Thermoplasmatota archaeon]|nr:hypothetical protein [Candidatus Thermoplasmatota archaeon]
MEEIADEALVEKFGIAIRLVEDSGTYIVQQAPVDQEGKYNENEFRVFGGPVGYVSSEFDDEDDAQKFFNDIQILSNDQLSERYPKMWII